MPSIHVNTQLAIQASIPPDPSKLLTPLLVAVGVADPELVVDAESPVLKATFSVVEVEVEVDSTVCEVDVDVDVKLPSVTLPPSPAPTEAVVVVAPSTLVTSS